MDGKIFLTALLSILVQVSSLPETYRGAVVEYHPVSKLTPELTMAENVKNYITFIKSAAAKRADIIVFPEGGLLSSVLSPIPDPSEQIIPCESKTFVTTQAVKDLSLAAKENSIYTVVNLLEKRKCSPDDPNCPSTGSYIFNTNVVFDRRGMVIARYAKYNLFDEFGTNHPADPEMSFFDTDFNVRFGTFICFDILFPSPAQRLVQQYQITDFVFTTFWFSELPFLTALQAQRGWAEANNVNLLASGVNFPSKGSGGSGIYNGKYGHLVETMPEKETSKLLIADVPIIKSCSCSNTFEKKTRVHSNFTHVYNTPVEVSAPEAKAEDESDFHLLKDQIHLFSSEVINPGETFEKTLCSGNNFCCEFYVNIDSLKPQSANYTFRAMSFNGVRKFGLSFRGGVQSCGVVLCNGPHIQNCTSRIRNIFALFKVSTLRIKGNFNLRNSFQMPTTLVDGKELRPLPANKYEFTTKRNELKSEVSLELLWPVYDLQTFGIWGRDFTRDNEPEVPTAGTSVLLPLPVMFGSILGFLLFLR